MDSYDKSKQPLRPLSRAVSASHVLAVVSIAAAVIPLVVWWLFNYALNFEATVFTGHAIGWITALVAYAICSDFERALPLIALAINFIFTGGILFLYCWLVLIGNGLWTSFLILIILDYVLPVAAFFLIMLVKARLRTKNGWTTTDSN